MRSSIALLIAACTGHGAPARQDSGGGGPDAAPFTTGTSTLAGAAEAGDVDGGREVARFANPVDVAYRDGKLYVADFDNGKIRVIDAATADTTTLIEQPGFLRPFALAFAPDGTLYATTDDDRDGQNSAMTGSIWRIDVRARVATVVANAIGRPRGLGVLADGRLIASDYLHDVIELVDPGSGAGSVLAGTWDAPGHVDATGADARFAAPYGLVVRADGSVVVADYTNNVLRVVTLDGAVTTFAGTGVAGYGDGPVATAMFLQPQGLALSASGDLYVTDSGNFRVRRISGAVVQTVAGNGVPGYHDDADSLASELYGLEGLAVVPDGSIVYVADGGRGEDVPYNRVRQIRRAW